MTQSHEIMDVVADKAIDKVAESTEFDEAEKLKAEEELAANASILREFDEIDPDAEDQEKEALKKEALALAIAEVVEMPEFKRLGVTEKRIRSWIEDERTAPLEPILQPYYLQVKEEIDSMASIDLSSEEAIEECLVGLSSSSFSLGDLGRVEVQEFDEEVMQSYLEKLKKGLEKIKEEILNNDIASEGQKMRTEKILNELMRDISDVEKGALLANIRYNPPREHLDEDDIKSPYLAMGVSEVKIKDFIKSRISIKEMEAYKEAGFMHHNYEPYLLAGLSVKDIQDFMGLFSKKELWELEDVIVDDDVPEALAAGVQADVLAIAIRTYWKYAFSKAVVGIIGGKFERMYEKSEGNEYVFFGELVTDRPSLPLELAQYASMGIRQDIALVYIYEEGSLEAVRDKQKMLNDSGLIYATSMLVEKSKRQIQRIIDYAKKLPEEYNGHSIKASFAERLLDYKMSAEDARQWMELINNPYVILRIAQTKIDLQYANQCVAAGFDLNELGHDLGDWYKKQVDPHEVRALFEEIPEDWKTMFGELVIEMYEAKKDSETWGRLIEYGEAGVPSFRFARVYLERGTDLETIAVMAELDCLDKPDMADWASSLPREHHGLAKEIGARNYKNIVEDLRAIGYENPEKALFDAIQLGMDYWVARVVLRAKADPKIYAEYAEYISTFDRLPNLQKLIAFGVSKERLDLYKERARVLDAQDLDEIILSEYKQGHLSPKARAAIEEYNISFPSRYPVGILEGMINGYEVVDENPKKQAVVFVTQSDWNTAFDHNQSLWESLLPGYDVHIYEVSSETQFTQSLDRFGDRLADRNEHIGLMVVGGHGTKGSIKFSNKKGEESYLDLRDRDALRSAARYFDEDSKVVLKSCSTRKGWRNMARMFSRRLGGVPVIAPDRPTGLREFKYDEDGLLIDVEYSDPGAGGVVSARPSRSSDRV